MTIARQFIFFIKVAGCLFCQNLLADTTVDTNPPDVNTQQAAIHQITDADCIDFINENPVRVTCGFIELPVNHDKPTEARISLPVLIAGQTQSLSNTASDKAILIPGGGGPGASMAFGLQYQPGEYLEYYDSLRATGFDIVIVDQRGTGFAKPALRCHETVGAFISMADRPLTLDQALSRYKLALDRCHTRLLDENISLADFDTYQSARDFLAITDSLAYSWWGTVATSYATVIAQAMEIVRPGVFDRIVLDSPVPVDFQMPFTFASSEKSINRILSVCEITQRCNRRYKEIKEKFQTVLKKAKETPFTLSIKVVDENYTLKTQRLIVDDMVLLEILMYAAYSNYSISEIPWIINQLFKGRANALKQISVEYWYSNTDLEYADALSWIVHCKERLPLEEKYLSQHKGDFESYSAESRLAMRQEHLICAEWDVGRDKKITANLIKSETLILAGDLDPVISRKDVDNTSDNFVDEITQILPGMGHSVWHQSECARKNVVAFFTAQSNITPGCRDGLTRFR